MPTVTPETWIPITEVSVALKELTGTTGPGYRRLSVLACDGKISPPMEKRDGRWWGCFRSKLPELAEALGLTVDRVAA
jgi:hypothetical protein